MSVEVPESKSPIATIVSVPLGVLSSRVRGSAPDPATSVTISLKLCVPAAGIISPFSSPEKDIL